MGKTTDVVSRTGAFSFRIKFFLSLQTSHVPMHRYSSPKEALKQVFGYDAFRGFQEEVVRAVVRGEDVLVLMPTRWRQESLLSNTCTIARRCGSGGIALDSAHAGSGGCFGRAWCQCSVPESTLTPEAAADVRRRLRCGELDLLYVAPERLLMSSMQALLSEVKISLFAIDEAHA